MLIKDLVTSPLFYIFLSLVITIISILLRRFNKFILTISSIFLFFGYFFSTPTGANYLVHLLSINNSPKYQCYSNKAVLLTAGLIRKPSNLFDFNSMTYKSLKRANGAIKYFIENRASNIYISGSGMNNSNYPESQIVLNYLKSMGIPHENMILDNESTSTYLSAINLSKVISDKHITLITSQIHMRLAKLSFEKSGFYVCTHVSDYQYNNVGYFSLFWNEYSIQKSHDSFHEILGLIWYSLTDRL